MPTRPAASGAGRTCRLHCLGTAGHIDHGKTALITRLTGKNTDRLREEQERGISIELGYAELELPGGGRLSVVDVPGHERFVRTMVAGATGVDLFLLVIAADDGVMPQTMEHLAIIELLGVRDGVVALTKADIVDEELLELAEADVREFLAGTRYAGCEVVTVSARDGRGIDELLAALERAAERTEAGRRAGPARLPVDRVFPLKGIGTVVTGTLWAGEIKPGDVLVVEPGGARAAVRSVQVHDHEADVVHAGSRVGVNLRGVDRGEHRPRRLAGRARARGTSRAPLRRLGLGASRSPAAALGRPGAAAPRHGAVPRPDRAARGARDRARRRRAWRSCGSTPTRSSLPHDRFIVRSLSPVATIAGGEVLLAGAHRWHARERHAAFLAAVRAGDPRAAVAALAADRGQAGLTKDDLAAAGFGAGEAGAALAAAVAAGDLDELPAAGGSAARWFAAGVLAALRAALLAGAAERAAARPERPFSGAAELAALVPALPPADAGLLLQGMVEAGELVAGEGGYAPAGAGVLGDDQAALAGELLDRLGAEPMAPPTLATLAEELRPPAARAQPDPRRPGPPGRRRSRRQGPVVRAGCGRTTLAACSSRSWPAPAR